MKAIIVGAAALGKELHTLQEQLQRKDALVIAADNGIQILATCDVKPDYWVGDLDSYEQEIMPEWLEGICFDKLPVQKDETDMAVALAHAYEKGCREISIFGAVGGKRPSHTMANIQLAYAYSQKMCNIILYGDGYQMEVIVSGDSCNTDITGNQYGDQITSDGVRCEQSQMGCRQFDACMTGHISIFALTDVAQGVCIRGLQYEYDGDLYNHNALGVSNAFVGKEASVCVADGALLMITEEKS